MYALHTCMFMLFVCTVCSVIRFSRIKSTLGNYSGQPKKVLVFAVNPQRSKHKDE